MIEQISEDGLDTFETPAVANVATVLPDGTPHITPAWLLGYRPSYPQYSSIQWRPAAELLANS